MKGPGKHYPLTPQAETNKQLEGAIALYKASLSWYWRGLAILVALATITSAVFEALNYFRG
jgi:hypothetical protein